MRKHLSQLFPPPHYLQPPVIGVDISDISVRFTELISTRAGFQIGRFGERAIPRGVIESGEVKKPAELRAVLAELKKQYDLHFVAVALPEEKAYLFDLEIAHMKRSEIRGALELVLEEHVPLKASEALFDYRIEKETETTILVNVSVFPRALMDEYLAAFSGTGIIPLAFEIEAHALARAIVPALETRSVLIVDFGKTRTGVTIVSGGHVEFTSTIPIGGSALTDATAKQLSISYDEAEKIKREKGLANMAQNSDLTFAIMSLVGVLRDEIRKNYAYWQTHTDMYGKKRPPIEKIYLCGGEANLPGFAEYLAEGISVPIELADVFVNTHSLEAGVPKISFSDSLRYATAVGLALRPPRAQSVNLLPLEEKKRNHIGYLLRLSTLCSYVAAFLVIASFALLAPSYIRAVSKKNTAEVRIEHTTGMSAEERARAEKEAVLEIKSLNKKLDIFAPSIASSTLPAMLPSEAIGKILGWRGTSLKIQSIAYDKTAERERFVVAGVSSNREGLAQFVETLKKDTSFTKVEIPLSSYVKSTDISFSLVIERTLVQKQTKKQ